MASLDMWCPKCDRAVRPVEHQALESLGCVVWGLAFIGIYILGTLGRFALPAYLASMSTVGLWVLSAVIAGVIAFMATGGLFHTVYTCPRCKSVNLRPIDDSKRRRAGRKPRRGEDDERAAVEVALLRVLVKRQRTLLLQALDTLQRKYGAS